MRQALRERFGHARLRPGQLAVIRRVLTGRSTLAIMPTGAGKSLCYQLPAVLLPGRTVVVSPLIALMKDQCEALAALGIPAVQVNSALDGDEARAAEAAVEDGSARVVMTTPERFADPAFRERLTRHPVSLVAVDEAHCISHWGHDFRPAFLEIGPALAQLGTPTVLALTATATDDVARDIAGQLGLPADGVLNTGTYRPNLDLRVVPLARDEDKLEPLLAQVRASDGCGVVYTATVKAAVAVHAALQDAGESAGLYHGRLAAADRHAAQEAFMEDRHRIMVATNAFGLGIDKPDIRLVLHYQVPATLEAYYQEAGRAGRDGEPARCVLLFLRGDKAIQQFFLAGRYPAEDDAVAVYDALRQPPPDGEAWTLALLQGRLARPRSKLQVALGLLRRDRVVRQAPDGRLEVLQPGVDPARLRAGMQAYANRRDQDRAALERMVFYAQTGSCRWHLLLEHLDGESSFERCGHCDNCRRIAAHEAVVEDLLDQQPAPGPQAEGTGPGFARGDIVEVRRYGRGIVEEATALQVSVAFADGARRAFLPEYVRPAQARPRRRAARAGPAGVTAA